MSRTLDERLIKAWDKIHGRGARAWVVDPSATRNGTGGNGTPDSPFADFVEAYALMSSGRGDALLLLGGPTAGASTDMTVRLSSAFTWAKHNSHLYGMCAETRVGQRARITGPSTGGTFADLFTVSGHGCRFRDIALFDDYTVDPRCLIVSGQRNLFKNVNIQGMGAATGADDAAACSLAIAGGAENTFDGCVIGLDTIPRSAANAEIRFTSAAKRNFFQNCDIVAYCDSATHLFVDASASGSLDRWTVFDNCRFHNAPTGIASGLTMTQAMNVHASAGGYIWVTGDSSLLGTTDWAAADNGNVFVDRVVAAAGTAGLAVAVTR